MSGEGTYTEERGKIRLYLEERMEAISDLLFLMCLHHMHMHVNTALFCSGYFLLCCPMTAKTNFFKVLLKVFFFFFYYFNLYKHQWMRTFSKVLPGHQLASGHFYWKNSFWIAVIIVCTMHERVKNYYLLFSHWKIHSPPQPGTYSLFYAAHVQFAQWKASFTAFPLSSSEKIERSSAMTSDVKQCCWNTANKMLRIFSWLSTRLAAQGNYIRGAQLCPKLTLGLIFFCFCKYNSICSVSLMSKFSWPDVLFTNEGSPLRCVIFNMEHLIPKRVIKTRRSNNSSIPTVKIQRPHHFSS